MVHDHVLAAVASLWLCPKLGQLTDFLSLFSSLFSLVLILFGFKWSTWQVNTGSQCQKTACSKLKEASGNTFIITPSFIQVSYRLRLNPKLTHTKI